MFDLIGILVCTPIYTAAVIVLGGTFSIGLFVFHVTVVPLIFKFSKTFRRTLVFANYVQWPLNIDFEEPSASGIDGTRNLSIEYFSKIDDCPVRIGMWHILPKTVYEKLKGNFKNKADKEELNRLMDHELANSKTPIILYFHGNSNSRAASHRVELYKFFQQMEFHTITFDYRGFADSTNLWPTEIGVVEDSLFVYEWLITTLEKGGKNPPVFVWGHSLGTGISAHLLGNLQELSTNVLERSNPLPLPNGLILEAPFNNLADEVAKHPLSKLVAWLPYFEIAFVAPFRDHVEHRFRSDRHLARAKSLPVLVLHARDDIIVPFDVGVKLFGKILASRTNTDAEVILHAYDVNLGLGHKGICQAPDLTMVISKFIKDHP